MTMVNSFLIQVQKGKNTWWRYALGLFLVIVLSQTLGNMLFNAIDALVELDGNPNTRFDDQLQQYIGIDPSFEYVAYIFSSLVIIGALWVVIRLIHKRSFKSLITGASRIRIRRVLLGFGLWLALLGAGFTIANLLPVGSPPASSTPPLSLSYLIFLPIAILLTPIQTTSEEILFRGYLLQGLYLGLKRVWPAIIVSSLLFGFIHFFTFSVDPTFLLDFAGYAGFGVFAAIITLKDRGLELAIGAHAANNIIGIPDFYTMPVPTDVPDFGAAESGVYLVTLVLTGLAFYFLVFRPKLVTNLMRG